MSRRPEATSNGFFESSSPISPGRSPALPRRVYPFEYPHEWVFEGRGWNEIYVIRSFLQFNDSFEIVLFPNYLAYKHLDAVEELCPRLAPIPERASGCDGRDDHGTGSSERVEASQWRLTIRPGRPSGGMGDDLGIRDRVQILDRCGAGSGSSGHPGEPVVLRARPAPGLARARARVARGRRRGGEHREHSVSSPGSATRSGSCRSSRILRSCRSCGQSGRERCETAVLDHLGLALGERGSTGLRLSGADRLISNAVVRGS